jgi:hypothetical protein
MRRIFVSYAREDLPMVEPLVERLRAHRFRVTWDHDLRTGQQYREALRAEIERADRVIAVWTRASVASHWVQGEADLALEREKLLPLRFEAVEPPLPFNAIQSGDFIAWDGSADAKCFQQLLQVLSPARDSTGPVSKDTESLRPVARVQHTALVLASFVAIAVAVPVVLKVLNGSVPPPPSVVNVAQQGASSMPVLPPSTEAPAATGEGETRAIVPATSAPSAAGAPAPPTAKPSASPSPAPVGHCCHPVGGRVPCDKPRCSDCRKDYFECSK